MYKIKNRRHSPDLCKPIFHTELVNAKTSMFYLLYTYIPICGFVFKLPVYNSTCGCLSFYAG